MTFQQDFFDAMIRHQVDLLRFGAGLSKRVHGLLDATEEDIRRQIERRLKRVTGITPATLARLQRLEKSIAATRLKAWGEVTGLWVSELADVAVAEPAFVAGTIDAFSPFQVDTTLPHANVIRAAVMSRPFQGRHLREWAKSAEQSDIRRIHQAIRIGVVQGEPVPRIVSRVLGAKGATSLTRHQATAVTRTAINHVSSTARQVFAEENRDIAPEELFVATLDARTTVICMGLDGKRHKVGTPPRTPQHVGCRSTNVPIIDGQVLGERPFKAFTEKQLLREYAEQSGFKPPATRAGLPRGHKGKFDAFARRRGRELTGQLPAKTTYQDWLARQTREFQDDVLGPKRAKLFRDGKLTLDRYTDAKGRELTLDDLRKRYPKHWARAGFGKAPPDAPPPPPAPPRPPPAPPSPPARATAGPVPDGVALELVGKLPAKHRDHVMAALDRAGLSRFYDKSTGRKLRLLMTTKSARRATALDDRVGQGALGEYYANPKRGTLKILVNERTQFAAPMGQTFTVSQASKDYREQLRRVAIHELGHAVHLHGADETWFQPGSFGEKLNRIPWDAFKHPQREWISKYATTNYKEYFAEAFTAYHTEPEWLRANAPRAYRMVEDVLRLREML